MSTFLPHSFCCHSSRFELQREKKMELLPEDCIALVLSRTSPCDACRLSLLSTAVRDAAESELLWEKFLPSDYRDILSRSASPFSFTSKKDLFLKLSNPLIKLSHPLLIDGGTKMFSIDKFTSKKCYMLSARELTIAWGSNRLYWCWKPFLPSRFSEVVELVMTNWLDIQGKISCRMLSPDTMYGAYLVIKLAGRAYGLESIPSEVSVEFGNFKSCAQTYLRRRISCSTEAWASVCVLHTIPALASRAFSMEERFLNEREDGWLELELGEFYNDGSEKEVKMSLREVRGDHLKGGLIVEGIEEEHHFPVSGGRHHR